MRPKARKQKVLNIIRGKNLVGAATKDDISLLFSHIDSLEMFLDENDKMDMFGTEGWRFFLEITDK